jgi:hypothetical protein
MVKKEQVLRRYHSRIALTVGETIENGMIRVHRYRDVIHVWDLTNAGKRGKRVERVSIESKHISSASASLLNEIGDKLERCNDLGQVKKILSDYSPGQIDIGSYFEKSVDVAPAGFKEISIHTPHVFIEVEYKSFTVKNLDDRYNEPTCIPAIHGGLRSIPVFYRWVQDNRDAINRMDYHQILEQMDTLGVRYHSYCAMD